MGNSAPPPATIDLVGSYARLRGADAELVFWAPQVAHRATVLTLTKGQSRASGTAQFLDDEAGQRLVARVPRSSLTDGIWALRLDGENGEDNLVEARLLVQGARPLVLLWGGTGTKSEVPKAGRAPTSKRRAILAGERVVDRALQVLPAEQAIKVRAIVSRTARRVLL